MKCRNRIKKPAQLQIDFALGHDQNKWPEVSDSSKQASQRSSVNTLRRLRFDFVGRISLQALHKKCLTL